MSIADIFYSEFNRIRDKKESKEKMEKDIKELLYKLLHRFSIDIEQFHQHIPVRGSIEEFYNRYREDLLNITVEVEQYISKDLFEKLKKISLKLAECIKFTRDRTTVLGGMKVFSGDNTVLISLGEDARKIALEIMDELKKEF